MGVEEIFGILGIEPTKDEGLIKQAYRNKLTVTNPEDNPEGFKRLRKAYDEAVAYSKMTDAVEDGRGDTSPSGLWVARAAKIYENITTRCDVGEWKRLFGDELFLSIDGEEECREKLLVFMMDHVYFPTQVWKLLDEKLAIHRSFSSLKEKFPLDYLNYLMNKCSRGEDIEFSLFEGAPCADYDLYLQKYNQAFRALEGEDTKFAKSLLEEMERLGVSHPVANLLESAIFVHEDDLQGAVKCMEAAYAKYPHDATTAYNYGQLLWKIKEKASAAEIFLKIKNDNDDHYMSNYYLSQWYYDNGDYKTSKKCAEKVMALGGGEDLYELIKKVNTELEKEYIQQIEADGDVNAGIELSWCYLQDGRYFEGLKLAKGLYEKLPKDEITAYYGLLAKLNLEESEYEECIEYAGMWRKGLLQRLKDETGSEYDNDINRLYQTYAIRTNAYHMEGFQKKECFERALSEADAYDALDENLKMPWEKSVSIYLEKAQVLLDMDRTDECIEYSDWLLEEKQLVSINAVLVDAYAKKLDAGRVVKSGRECIEYFAQYAKAYEQVAKVFLDLEYKEELDRLLGQAKEEGVESQILDAYKYLSEHEVPDAKKIREKLDEFEEKFKRLLLERHDARIYEEGYPEITRLLNEYPSNYMLIERGRFSMDALDYEKAEADFIKVLDRRTDEQFALNNLGCIYKYTERYDEAIVCFKRAIRYMDEEPNVHPYANLAHTYERMGEYGLATVVYETAAKRFPAHDISDDLRDDYAKLGDVDKAKAIVDEKKGNLIGTVDEYLYFSSLHEVYKYSDNLEMVARNLERERKSYARIFNRDVKERAMNRYRIRKAGLDVINGELFIALGEMRKVVSTLGSDVNDNEADYVLDDIIMALTLVDYARESGNVLKRGIRGIFPKTREDVRAELEKYADMLERELNPGPSEWNRNPYLYCQKQRHWHEFLIAFAREAGVEVLESIIEKMDGCHMCRSCSFKSCNDLAVARGMLLERQGKLTEAIEVYKALQKEQPFEWYSKMRLRYLVWLNF